MDTNQELEMYRAEAAAATKAAAIASSLAGRELPPAAVEQLGQLWRNDIQLIAGADGRRVAIGPGGQSVKDFVAAQLAKPEYSHFVRGGNRGSNASATAAAPGYSDGPPRTLQEAITRQIQENQAAQGGVDPRTNPRIAMTYDTLRHADTARNKG